MLLVSVVIDEGEGGMREHTKPVVGDGAPKGQAAALVIDVTVPDPALPVGDDPQTG